MIRNSSRQLVTATIVAGIFASLLSAGVAARGEAAGGAVTISVKYTGKGDVDRNHRIWVWLFDTPEVGPGAMPIAEVSTENNGGEVTADVSADTVWIAVAYDEAGGFGGMAPPPSGSPVAIHSAPTGAPLAVKAGQAEKISVAFSDKIRMP
jgi:hypothetical protein